MNKKDKLKELIEASYPNLNGMHKEKFMHILKETGLDPLRNQIYVVERNIKTAKGWEKTFTVQTSIDGFRLIAERTGKYAPGKEPKWNYDQDGNLESATAYVKKMTPDGTWHEVGATAYLDEYAQRDKNNNLTRFWKKMARLMISKCAEALALRKAFPDALSGVYTDDEMLQANQKNEQNDNQNENKKTISKEEIDILVSLLNKVPAHRARMEKLLEQQGIDNFDDMPFEMYKPMLAQTKLVIENSIKNKKLKPAIVRSKKEGVANAGNQI